MAAMGVGCGIVVGLGAGRMLGSLLYGVTFYDPVSVLGTAGVVGLVTFSMTYVAGHRARNLDFIAGSKSA